MNTLQEKYNAIAEGKFDKVNFVREAKNTFPNFITPANTFDDVVKILKNKGVLTESKKEQAAKPVQYPLENFLPEDNYSLYEIDLGVRVELDKMGLLPGERPTEEQYEKARGTALKNLKKDRNCYSVPNKQENRKDLPKEVTKSQDSLVDSANSMQKVKLQESFTKLIKKIVENK